MPSSPFSASRNPRKALPSSSPPSARLRRIAPSPVKIPRSAKSTPLKRPHGASKGGRFSSSHGGDTSSPSSAVEFDFEPLELVILASPDTQVRTLFEVLEDSKRTTQQYHGQARDIEKFKVTIPLIFDASGDFGRLAYETRLKCSGGDCPDECDRDTEENQKISITTAPERDLAAKLNNHYHQHKAADNLSSKRRSGLTLLNPAKYLSRMGLPSPVLINFNEDIFGTGTGSDTGAVTATPAPKNTSTIIASSEKALLQMEEDQTPMSTMGPRLDREDSAQTFNTLGVGLTSDGDENQPDSAMATATDEELDSWSFTLSAYDEEVISLNTPSLFRKDSFFAFGGGEGEIETESNTKGASITSSEDQSSGSTTLGISYGCNPTTSSSYMLPSNIINDDNCNVLSVKRLKVDWAGLRQDTRRSEIDSPLSDAIITPQLHHATSGAHDLLRVDHGLQDTPTPKDAHASVRLRPKSRIVSAAKNLPTLSQASTHVPHNKESTMNNIIQPQEEQVIGGKAEEIDSIDQALQSIDKSLTIQLWVDQEGCRENRSSLKFIRYIRPSVFREREEKALKEASEWCESPTRPESFQQSGCWEFGMDPKQRDKWSFHHAALEGLPVLRRLTTNNDDKFDYLSRGATLQIKEPGVYCVCGQEERGKAEWKFEYLVQNKRSINSGEQIANERIIVPLALYVSPNFFNPDRALKTSLLNLFKKTLASNIMSEKVKPPHIGRPPAPKMKAQIIDIEHEPRANGLIGSGPDNDDHSTRPNASDTNAKTQIDGGGRKRSQTHTQVHYAGLNTTYNTTSSSTGTSHSRSVSRTIGAIAKAVAGMSASTSTTTTPTQTHYPEKAICSDQMADVGRNQNGMRPSSSGSHIFGSKAPTFGRPGLSSRSGSTTPTNAVNVISNSASTDDAEEKKKSSQSQSQSQSQAQGQGQGPRKRSTSLFSRSRPFTPPVNITEIHPVPQRPVFGFGEKSRDIPAPAISSPPTTAPSYLGAGAGTAAALASVGKSQLLGIPMNGNHTSISLPWQANHNHLSTSNRTPMSTLMSTPIDNAKPPSPSPKMYLQPNISTPNGIYLHHTNTHTHTQTHTILPNYSNVSLLSTATGSSSNLTISPIMIHTPLLSRSSSITSRSRPIMRSSNGTGTTTEDERDVLSQSQGTSAGRLGAFGFAKRGIRKRPSTAEPRLGMR
ncbi:uncharacterized protein I303_108679 [Kwoniella dejecticola CBS 10117]|uniref:Uncharacterized protein n=1 Tax=Kwoniella dejecticola CBS 10117 TaxID=1296121 RepID=A0A1A5ZWQ2_9TREE|nr:uncharacterized protein I303_06996 [Kwoniella dejecticola CBS 10117]OBR82237.1 hypothetical protein I303_06996 [Kwoniella dejecticola CBS 10117]